MLEYTTHQLATIIIVPIISILTIWTVAIFHKNRKQWKPYDITIVAILVQSMLRQMAVFCYTMLTILQQNLGTDFCTPTIWVFNCLHTFQASSLTTLALIGLFSIKLYRKQQNIKQFLTVTHIVYHLFCLTTLCACVGVAAILARHDWGATSPNLEKSAVFEFEDSNKLVYNDLENCKFLPYELDVKYNVFIIALLGFLALVSVCAFIGVVFNYYKMKYSGFDYLKKSTSDLSDLSLGAAASVVSPSDQVMKNNYFDTYSKGGSSNADTNSYMKRFESQTTLNNHHHGGHGGQMQNIYGTKDVLWNSDTSNISTSVSSTNSRRPCLAKGPKVEEDNGAGLETILPVLIVCYLFYHLPVVALCTFPWVIAPWPVAGAALWLGILQDLLIPVGLGLVDSRFCTWVSKVYRCTDRQSGDKLPHGVDGKFRHFGSQPQSLEVMQLPGQERMRPGGHHVEHKFPITNGSLYTSIDGRVPVIHNYRRHKAPTTNVALNPNIHGLSINMGLHSSHIKRQEFILNHPTHYEHLLDAQNVHFDSAFISLPSEYSSMNGQIGAHPGGELRSNLHLVLNQNHLKPSGLRNQEKPTLIPRNLSSSQGSLNSANLIETEMQKLRQRNLGCMSKSQDSLTEFSKRHQQDNVTQRDIKKFKQNPAMYEQIHQNSKNAAYESSDEEFFDESLNMTGDQKNFDTLSSQSCYSITTEANCDFEFYGQSNNSSSSSNEDDSNHNPSKNPSDNNNVHQSKGHHQFHFKNNVGETTDTLTTTTTFNNSAQISHAQPPKSTPLIMRSFKPQIPPKLECAQNFLGSPRNNHHNHSQQELMLNLRNSKRAHQQAVSQQQQQERLQDYHRITRSNSKRSLENFQAFISEDATIRYLGGGASGPQVKRSNSCISIEAVNHHNHNQQQNYQNPLARKISRSSSKCSGEKICLRDIHNIREIKKNMFRRQQNCKSKKTNPVMSMESLNSILSHGEVSYLDNGDICNHNYGGSVPDFKKIFVSDYI